MTRRIASPAATPRPFCSRWLFLLSGEKDRLGSFKAGMEGNYGENTTRSVVDGVEIDEDETTVASAKLFGNVKKTLSPRTFVYLDGSVLNDDIAEIDYRATVDPGLGLYLVKTDSTAFSAEVGVEAPLQGKLNLRVVLQDKYDSQPGEDLEKNDLVLIAGVGIKL